MLARTEGHTAQLIESTQIRDILEEWQALAEHAAESNVYYAPHYARALLETVDRSARITFVTIWQKNKLVALLPVTRQKLPIPDLRAAGAAWTSPYTYSCTPLIDRGRPAEAAAALLDGLAALRAGNWVISQINLGGPVYRALTEALDLRGAPWRTYGTFERAFVSAGASFESHMKEHVAAKRRRELARNRRRLEEAGAVAHECHTCGPGLARAVEAFLRIEASGWKGQRTTALACQQSTREFATLAFRSSPQARCRADLLLLDGQPIAAGLIALSGDTGFTVKCAYDERYASCSAGLLLEVEVLKSFLTDGWAGKLDAATNGKHVIDLLWPGRTRVGTLAMSFSQIAPAFRLSALETAHGARSKAKSWIKSLVRR